MAKGNGDNNRLERIERLLDGMVRDVHTVTAQMPELRTQGDEVKTRVDKLSTDVANTRERISWFLGGLAVLSLIGVAGFTSILDSRIESVVRRVQKEDRQNLKTFVQVGKFSPKTQVSDDPPTFDWALLVPVKPETVASLVAEPREPLAGTMTTASITDNGKTCRMVLYGSDAAIASLPEIIDAKVTIVAAPQ